MNHRKNMAIAAMTVMLLAMLAAPAAATVTAEMHVSPPGEGGVSYMYDENGDKLQGDGEWLPWGEGPDDLIQVFRDYSKDGITPPDPSNPGQCLDPSDDVLIDTFPMGQNYEEEGGGVFGDCLYPYIDIGAVVQLRVWNAPTVEEATYYEDSPVNHTMLDGTRYYGFMTGMVDWEGGDPSLRWNTTTPKPTPPAPETSFVIGGYVFDSDGSPCNDPGVQITNLNTSGSWTATKSATSNYYRLVLDSGNVSVNDTLRLDASGCGQSKRVTHPVTQDEIDDGGIFNLNITLGLPITSCNDAGVERNAFHPGENVSVKGSGLVPNTNYTLWIQDDPVCEGYMLCAGNATYGDGAAVLVRTDATGSFGPTLLWSIPETTPVTHDKYDIVADKQDDGAGTGRYNALSDCIDDAETHGVEAPIPELPSIVLLAVGLLGLALLVRREK